MRRCFFVLVMPTVLVVGTCDVIELFELLEKVGRNPWRCTCCHFAPVCPAAYQYHVHRKQQPLLDITLASIIIFAIKCRHSHFHVLLRAQRGKARRDNSYSN